MNIEKQSLAGGMAGMSSQKETTVTFVKEVVPTYVQIVFKT